MVMHSDLKPYPCSYCSKKFGKKGDLDRHVLLHMGIKPYECSVCLRRFTQAAHMRAHMMTHQDTQNLQVEEIEINDLGDTVYQQHELL